MMMSLIKFYDDSDGNVVVDYLLRRGVQIVQYNTRVIMRERVSIKRFLSTQ